MHTNTNNMNDWIYSLSSILNNTETIVEKCQEMELQPNLSFQALDTILVAQLAALVHLKEYTRAKDLSRRYSSLVRDHSSSHLPQFLNLWRALKPLFRFHSQHLSDSSVKPLTNAETTSFEKMQIATIYESLNTCIATGGGNILSVFARELQLSIRDTMAKAIERIYDVIHIDHCKYLLGYSTLEKDGQQQNMEEYLFKERHWTFESSSGLWIPRNSPLDGKEEVFGKGCDSRIKSLTKYSEFLERPSLNA
mmetsp:Transcript_16454/g.31181  ORF Transcript_16454/g.31181 Transcript_16454/m.31181 type:complete len:251 (-) Transcript_16454:634-1386(-)